MTFAASEDNSTRSASAPAHLGFWTEAGDMTRLPVGLVNDERLPTDADGLREMLHGLVIHTDMLHLYGMSRQDDPPAEIHLRPVTEMLTALREKADLPMIVTRPPQRRLQGSCRHFAVLLSALLRARGTPSRVRAGFASYFEPGLWEDHWIVEYWNPTDERWQLADGELDPVEVDEYDITFDPGDLPDGAFLPGATAWRRYRRGDLDGDLFGFGNNRGSVLIAGAVIRDLAALNKHEMLPWDYWGLLDEWDRGRLTVDPSYVDVIAEAVGRGEVAGIREVYRRPELAVPGDLSLVRADR
ncbi:transglutaminase-like domain-containing protein [Micromonospora sp. NPDC049662]|uniref:transglutaminase-like domain-containing protein n=1 Tax=Micromonospora sp. NPDC049662 TaxID=3155397 RepID=UPI00341DE2DB